MEQDREPSQTQFRWKNQAGATQTGYISCAHPDFKLNKMMFGIMCGGESMFSHKDFSNTSVKGILRKRIFSILRFKNKSVSF